MVELVICVVNLDDDVAEAAEGEKASLVAATVCGGKVIVVSEAGPVVPGANVGSVVAADVRLIVGKVGLDGAVVNVVVDE